MVFSGKIKKIMSVLLTIIMCFSLMGVSVYAANYSVSKDDAKAFQTNDELSSAAGAIGLSVAEGGAVTVDTSKLADMSEKEQNKAMNEFVTQLNKADVSVNGTNAISEALKTEYKDVAGVQIDILLMKYIFDKTQGDLTGAMGIISPFLPVINIIIGVVAIILAAILILSTVIDLAFIGLPMIREAMMAGGDGSGNGTGGGSKPKALTYACWSTINDIESALGGGGGSGNGGKSGYKNAYGLYFKRRVADYILLGVCLSFLIFGGFSRFIGALLGIGSQLVG